MQSDATHFTGKVRTTWTPHNFRVPDRHRLSKEISTQEFEPSSEIAPYVDCFWSMKWELQEDQEISALVLPSGCVNILAFIHANSLILVSGPKTKVRPFPMKGRGQILGVRFRPGGFFPFYGKPVSNLTDQAPAVEAVYQQSGSTLRRQISSEEHFQAKLNILSDFLSENLNVKWSGNFPRIATIFDSLASMESVSKICDMFVGTQASERSQQRIFERLVGMSPKAVLRTHRFQNVLNCLLETDEAVNWAELAIETGYYDQAHFVNDFREITGRSPTEFSPYNKKMSEFSNTRHRQNSTVLGSVTST
jgi:AraC-like DNA-binding protein